MSAVLELTGFLVGTGLFLYLFLAVWRRPRARLEILFSVLLIGLWLWFSGNLLALLAAQLGLGKTGWTVLFQTAAVVGLALTPPLLLHVHWSYFLRRLTPFSWERRLIPLTTAILYTVPLALPWAITRIASSRGPDPLAGLESIVIPFLVLLAVSYYSAAYLQWRLLKRSGDPVEKGLFRKLLPIFVVVPVFNLVVFAWPGQASAWGQGLAVAARLSSLLPGFIVAYYVDRHFFLATEVARALESKLAMERELARKSHMEDLGRMAATVAHNVKNPLSSMKTLMQLWREADNLTEEQRREVGMMIDEVDRLSQTVTHLLRFSRLEAGDDTSPVQDVSLQALFERVESLFRGDLKSRGLEFEVHVAPGNAVVSSRASALQEVLANLVSNAVDACAYGDCIRLKARVETPAKWEIRISDNGKGIPPQIRPNLFDPFVSSKTKGTGLGLAIVKKKVEGLGGVIDLIEPAEGGTCFRIRFK